MQDFKGKKMIMFMFTFILVSHVHAAVSQIYSTEPLPDIFVFFLYFDNRCGKRNYIRIWDGLQGSVWKPTELCGRYQDGDISVRLKIC